MVSEVSYDMDGRMKVPVDGSLLYTNLLLGLPSGSGDNTVPHVMHRRHPALVRSLDVPQMPKVSDNILVQNMPVYPFV